MSNPVWYNMQEAAHILNFKNLGRNNLMALLRDRGILNSQNMPADYYTREGYFYWNYKHHTGRYGKPVYVIVPLASMQGIELIRDIINDNDVHKRQCPK